MSGLPDADSLEVFLKLIERFGIVSTALLGIIAWLLIRYTRKAPTGSTEPDGWRLKIEADVRALRQIIDTQEQLWRQEFKVHHDQLIELRVQVRPIVEVINSKVVTLFHQPMDEEGLDHLIERFERDDSDLKVSFTEAELDALILGMQRWHRRSRPGGEAPDPMKEFFSGISWAVLHSVKDLRRLARERESQAIQEQRHREELTRYLQDAKAHFREASSDYPSLATRLKRWLWGAQQP